MIEIRLDALLRHGFLAVNLAKHAFLFLGTSLATLSGIIVLLVGRSGGDESGPFIATEDLFAPPGYGRDAQLREKPLGIP